MSNDTKPIAATDRLAFQVFSAQVAAHPACQHRVFSDVAQLAQDGKLTKEQVDMFTRAMMARIFRTMPNIAGLVQMALLTSNADMAETAMMNLEEEMGRDPQTHQKGHMHQVMAEEAFNILRRSFGLGVITMKQAHDEIPLPDSYAQEQVWQSGYRDFPAIASWLQERASGGSGDNQKGMMADMFRVFESCRRQGRINEEAFSGTVLPYFSAHNRVKKSGDGYSIMFDRSGIEFQHGQRAEHDALGEYAHLPPDRRRTIETMGKAFLDAQARLFDAIEGNIIGAIPLPPLRSSAPAASL